MGLTTPVAFLVFNRPDTTEQVFAAIRQAQPETLLLVADGPRVDRPGEAELCAKVRGIIEQIDWPCRVLKNFSEVNMGCKGRVSSGLDWVFSEVEEAIILEDDCLPHPDFFPFCQEMLARYSDDERIMMIGGINYLLDKLDIKDSYFFSRYFAIWGWATWRRAWEKYDINMQEWKRFKKEKLLKSYYSQGFMQRHLEYSFDLAYSKRINTWDIQWFYTCLFNNGLSIVPKVNLISNIGTIGVHSSEQSENHFFKTFNLDANNLLHPEDIYPNLTYDNQVFSEKLKPTIGDWLKISAFRVRNCLK